MSKPISSNSSNIKRRKKTSTSSTRTKKAKKQKSTPYAHYTENLLVLTQSDLTPTKSNSLLLCTAPIDTFTQSNNENSSVHILANDQQASLVVEGSSSDSSKSFQLTKVGTSNCLVVWNKKGERNDENTNNTTLCHLVQPGGSGATFLAATRNPACPSPSVLLELLGKGKKFLDTPDLANRLQVSCHEIVTGMAPLAQCLRIENDNSQKEGHHWTLLDEETIYQGRSAVVATVSEVDDHDNGTFPSLEEAARHVAQRLVGQFVLGRTSASHQLALATKCASLASSLSSSPFAWNPEVIALWVCQELLRERSQWTTSTFLETCQSRLPFGDQYDGLVTLSWLRRQQDDGGIRVDDEHVSLATASGV